MSCSHESVPLVFGPPGVWLQTLLLKHNCRVKQRQQNLIAAEMLKPRPRASGLGLETAAPSLLLLSQQLNGEGQHRPLPHVIAASGARHRWTVQTTSALHQLHQLRHFRPLFVWTGKLYCDFSGLQPLFDRLLCIPASSAPVERVFSSARRHLVAELFSSATKVFLAFQDNQWLKHSIRLFSITSGLLSLCGLFWDDDDCDCAKSDKKITASLVRCVTSFCINFVL